MLKLRSLYLLTGAILLATGMNAHAAETPASAHTKLVSDLEAVRFGVQQPSERFYNEYTKHLGPTKSNELQRIMQAIAKNEKTLQFNRDTLTMLNFGEVTNGYNGDELDRVKTAAAEISLIGTQLSSHLSQAATLLSADLASLENNQSKREFIAEANELQSRISVRRKWIANSIPRTDLLAELISTTKDDPRSVDRLYKTLNIVEYAEELAFIGDYSGSLDELQGCLSGLDVVISELVERSNQERTIAAIKSESSRLSGRIQEIRSMQPNAPIKSSVGSKSSQKQ